MGIIHDKALSLPRAAHDSSEAATLMSTDADGLEGVAEMFHETWAQTLEVAIGVVLLSREVGWIWPLPLILIFRGFGPSRDLFVLLIMLCSVLPYEPVRGSALTPRPEGLERGNPTAGCSNKLNAQLHEGHQDDGPTALPGEHHTQAA